MTLEKELLRDGAAGRYAAAAYVAVRLWGKVSARYHALASLLELCVRQRRRAVTR